MSGLHLEPFEVWGKLEMGTVVLAWKKTQPRSARKNVARFGD